jgi:hypothetical protein
LEKRPSPDRCKKLRPSTPEAVAAIEGRVNANVDQVVAEKFQESFTALFRALMTNEVIL